MKVYLLSCKLGFLDLALLLPPFNVSPKHEPVFRSPINHSSFPVKQYPFFHQVLSINYVQVLSINQLLDPHKLSLASLVIMQDRGKQVHLVGTTCIQKYGLPLKNSVLQQSTLTSSRLWKRRTRLLQQLFNSLNKRATESFS
ncbi:hypothetical protein BRADI_1g54106v3 [Brachypodium distachyon]|uniref:Uncharacterized protein n=1 Tax=Brachypodium distachyon TaxID=15368 RepID=A0A2K2DRC0_BRADI|nr:hypothetical protein BRADI_1g54106v3 [Brachypodium distachyon]